MRFLMLLALILLLLPGASQAQGEVLPEPEPFSDRYPARLVLTEEGDLETLYELKIDIDNLTPLDGSRGFIFEPLLAEVYVNPAEADMLRRRGLAVEAAPNEAYRAFLMYGAGMGIDQPSGWPSFEQYVARMQTIASNYPNLVRMISIGKSVQNRDIWCLKITDNPDYDEDEPEFKYTAAMHGNETTGIEMVMRFAETLTANYGSDSYKTMLVNEIEIWLCPIHNPDGYRNGSRYNANGVDINRNFPEATGEPWAPPPGSEPETRAMMNFNESHRFVMGASYHGGAQLVNYSWDAYHGAGHTCVTAPDNAVFYAYSRGYADRNPDILYGGFPNGVILGCRWYEVHGGMGDYSYVWHGEHHVVVEVSDVKYPPYSSMDTFWAHNQSAMLWWMERSLTGVRGLVTDALTGEPLKARVALVRAEDYPVRTDPSVGDYHRVLLPGTYTLRVTAPCYVTQTAQVTIPGGYALVRNFELQRDGFLSLSGTVTNALSGQPIQATVEVLELEESAVTNPESGSYFFTACNGSYTVRVSAEGYRSQTRQVTLSQSQVENFSLMPYQADLLVELTDGVSGVRLGGWLFYTITVTNPGGDPASGVSVVDDFPDWLAGVTWTCSGAGGGICPSSGSGDLQAWVTLPGGANVTFFARGVVVSPDEPFVNTAIIQPPPSPFIDPDLSNNTAMDVNVLFPYVMFLPQVNR